ncbi:hypothetical protein BV898_11104 [Hypsibius exemplaris]|uniref:Uncharacterized protein n=1 Tax=Hypsibius exemplaris TaxID=2072580 RepID=A0A1W0WHS1_HYPEX|nr:hypothetical protein BV898_11104 [Hypsibius exemplaris]
MSGMPRRVGGEDNHPSLESLQQQPQEPPRAANLQKALEPCCSPLCGIVSHRQPVVYATGEPADVIGCWRPTEALTCRGTAHATKATADRQSCVQLRSLEHAGQMTLAADPKRGRDTNRKSDSDNWTAARLNTGCQKPDRFRFERKAGPAVTGSNRF